MNTPAPHTSRHQPGSRPNEPLPKPYLTIPTRLIAESRDNPLALGVYALIARLYLVVQAPIPLSRGDIQRFDPTLKEGAVKRALGRLTAGGWIIEASGHKSRYIPSWGRTREGAARPWRIGADYLGCPRHVFTVRLDKAILDLYMGKLTPQANNTALVDRYFTAPLLGLRDVGAYLLALTGHQFAGTAALIHWGLVRDGLAQPLPDDGNVLALVSQRQFDDVDAIQLTAAGWQKLGLSTTRRSPQGAAPAVQPLFFVPPELIGDLIPTLIGGLIGQAGPIEEPVDAPESATPATKGHTATIQRTQRESREFRESPPTPPTWTPGGGGKDLQTSERINQRAIQPESESAKLLRSIDAFPSSIEELAAMPVALVGEAIAYAQAEPGIESVTGWVVEALRKHRDEGWPIPTPRRPAGATTRDQPIDVERYTHGAYADLFRLGSDLTGVGDPDPDSVEGVRVSPGAGASGQAPAENLAPPAPFTDAHGAADEAHLPGDPPLPAEPANEDLTHQLQAELMVRRGRQDSRMIAGLRVHVVGGTTRIICATIGDMDIVQREMIGAIQPILVRLGVPPQMIFTTRAGWKARREAGSENLHVRVRTTK